MRGCSRKGKSNDGIRRKGFGHTFQLKLTVLCAKVGSHFEKAMREEFKVPDCVKTAIVIPDRCPSQIDAESLHESAQEI